MVDEKTRTDVLEKIVEGPAVSTTVYEDEIIDIRNVKNVTNINENITNLTDVTNIKNVRNINNETIQRIDNIITDDVRYTTDTVDKSSTFIDRRDDTLIYDRIDINKTRITDDTTTIKNVRLIFEIIMIIRLKTTFKTLLQTESIKPRGGPKEKPKKPFNDHKEQCICEICTCG